MLCLQVYTLLYRGMLFLSNPNMIYRKGSLDGKPFAVVSLSDRNPDGTANIPKQPKKAPKPAPQANGASNSKQPLTVDDDDDLIIPEDNQPSNNKRPREGDGDEPAAKKSKVVPEKATEEAPAANGTSAAVVIDD